MTTEARPLRMALLGDVMLAGEWEAAAERGALASGFRDLRDSLCDSDLVFANLETAVDADGGVIEKEPRIVARPSTIGAALEAIRIDVVSLANNHAFDANPSGFEAVRRLLALHHVGFFGAGRDAVEGRRPLIVERSGVRLGFLGYVSLDTVPSHVATQSRSGVNPLIDDHVLADVSCLRPKVDHVVVSLHWGIEYCHVPGPEQVRLARAIVDRGASVVVGHHAHVVQGIEPYGAGVIAYNLGNLTTSDFTIGSRLAIKQTRRTRSSLVLHLELRKGAVQGVRWTPIRSQGTRIVVDDPYARRRVTRANRLVTAGTSPLRWKARRFIEDVALRTLWKLDPRVIRSLRRKHLETFSRNVARALRGDGPAA